MAHVSRKSLTDVSALAARYRGVREDSRALGAPLSDADATVQSMPDASPAKWHLAHTTWFFETMVLKPNLAGYEVFDDSYNYLFNSYYETIGERQPRPRRGMITRPALDEIFAYRAHVDAAIETLMERGPAPDVATLQVSAPRSQTPSLYKSLYQTAVDHELPDRVRDILVASFANEVDYNASVRPGDALTVLHSQVEPGSEEPSELLFASLTAGGVEKRFYRYKSDDGTVDYYDEDGRSGDRFLMRKPMERGVYRSGFGMRRHPILRRQRMHKGVDYAAPRGTPIYAAGDGVVKQAGWKAGYGRWVAIQHLNGYMTGYAHQSRIAKGIKPGLRVKQGQVIGYVGSTGFSTGPHLHFEVHVNGRPVNPLKIRLRRGKELSGEALVAFRSERDRIDALLTEKRIEVARR